MNLREMLVEMQRQVASDLHLRVGIKPTLRVHGKLAALEHRSDQQRRDERNHLRKSCHRNNRSASTPATKWIWRLSVTKLGRFRINLYRQRGTSGIAIRAVNTSVPTFEELNLPDSIREICEARRGLVIVTGTTGSGKSTTLAAMIEQINSTRSENIMTIEDPIEYIYKDKKSVIAQREVGADTENFGAALAACVSSRSGCDSDRRNS